MTKSNITVLLPVRNAAQYLDAYLARVSAFADSIIALEDGSTDCTLKILKGSSLVKIILSNPARPSCVGWNDSENRNRLLEAATTLAPKWILSLDADERIEPSDAHAVVDFVQHEAVKGFAYGFEMHRMLGGGDTCFDKHGLWNFRLFAYESHHRFQQRRFHFQPVPIQIPKSRRIKTTFRIQHFAGTTAEKRRARYEKYLAVDPESHYQRSYENLLSSPTCRSLWQVRRQDWPTILSETD
jgi:glycosyltransferase involved in cell wall biosynthesis